MKHCRLSPKTTVGSKLKAQGSRLPVEMAQSPAPRADSSVGMCSRGFTLAELLIVSMILLVLGAGLLTAFLSGQASYLSADASIQVQQEARRAFDSAVRELREAGGPPGAMTPSGVNTQQLDFQTALGYNYIDALGKPCPAANQVNGVCYGAKDLTGALHQGWKVRYRIDTAQRQFVRETRNGATLFDTRVLANYVDTAIANSFLLWNGSKTVTVSLRIVTPASQSSQLTGGSRSTGATPLTAQVRLRN